MKSLKLTALLSLAMLIAPTSFAQEAGPAHGAMGPQMECSGGQFSTEMGGRRALLVESLQVFRDDEVGKGKTRDGDKPDKRRGKIGDDERKKKRDGARGKKKRDGERKKKRDGERGKKKRDGERKKKEGDGPKKKGGGPGGNIGG